MSVFAPDAATVDYRQLGAFAQRPVEFGERFEQTFRSFRAEDQSVSDEQGLYALYQEYNRTIEERTGEKLFNPIVLDSFRTREGVDLKAQRQAEYDRRLADIRTRFPDIEVRTLADFRTERIRQAAELRRDLAAGTDVGFAGLGRFLGTMRGAIEDPVNLISMALGAPGVGTRAGVLAKIGTTAAREAAVSTAAELVIQPQVFGFKEEIGSPYTFGDAAENVAVAAIAGGVLGGAGGAASALLGRYVVDPAKARAFQRDTELVAAAANDLIEGRPVTAASTFRADLLSGSALGTRQDADLEAFLRASPDEAIDPAAVDEAATRPARTRVGAVNSQGVVRVFDDVDEAGRVQQRLERRGDRVLVEELPDGRYVLQREIDAEPLRQPNGEPVQYPNKRRADRVRAAREDADELTVVPYGRTENGRRGFTIVRGASDTDIEAIRSAPDAVEFPTAPDRSAATFEERRLAEQIAERDALFESIGRPALRRAVADTVRTRLPDIGFADPETAADVAAVTRAAERESAVSPQVLAEDIAFQRAEVDRLAADGLLTREEVDAALAELDRVDLDADGLGKAYDQAAACLNRSAA